VVLGIAAVEARSVALAGFGLDSLIEIGESTIVLWELADTAQDRRRRAMPANTALARSILLSTRSE
jgi:hypothetical protein